MTDTKFSSNRFDIHVKEVKYQKSTGLNEHYLSLLFNGSDFNVKLMNTLRRVCLNYIPVYAYAPELINIIENTSVAFNNDMMKLDLSLLPVFKVDPGIYNLDEQYWYDVNYADFTRKKHSDEKNVEFYINANNNTNNYIRITTNDAHITVDGKDIEMYDKQYPILLIELKPNQKFSCHMKAVLGIAERSENSAIWKSSFNAYYDEVKQNEFLFTVYGNNMFSERELLKRACRFVILKMEKLKSKIEEQIKKKEIVLEKKMIFIFENEDFTIGEPINYELQNHKDISFSGLAKSDQLVKSVTITAVCSENILSPVDALLSSFEIVKDKFHKIGFLLTELYDDTKNIITETSSNTSSDRKKVTKSKIKKKVKAKSKHRSK